MKNNKELDKLKNKKKQDKNQLNPIDKQTKNIKKQTNNKENNKNTTKLNNKVNKQTKYSQVEKNIKKNNEHKNEKNKEITKNKNKEQLKENTNNIELKTTVLEKKEILLGSKEKIKESRTEKIVLRKTKRKKKRLVLIISLIVILLILISGLIYFINEEEKEKIRLENMRKRREEEALVTEINSHYNVYVKTNKEADIYNENEEIIGKIANNIEFSLEKLEINKDTKYFKIKDFENTYIKYQDVEMIETLSLLDARYKNYIVFNQNIVTNDKTVFYDSNNNLVYEFNKSFDLPIIIKDTDKYGIEYNGRLLYVKKEDVKEIKDNYNTDLNNASGVAVLNYHAFYDENNATEVANCPTSICHSKKQFKQHLDYFKENNIFTLTMNEMEMYVDGKVQLPKSVLITIDDGGRTEHAVDMLTEYKMNATIFLVTAWFDPEEFYKSEYIELHSHSHNLHNGGECPGGQGGAIKCLNRETLLEDLITSRELLNNTTAFCFPFYEFNEYSISVLKEAGFTMAFIGERGDMLVKVGDDKFRLTRFVIHKGTTMYALDNYFDKIKN